MIDQAFRLLVSSALEHLHDAALLEVHPLLAQLKLPQPGDPRSGAAQLRAALQVGIEALRPSPDRAASSPNPRPYQALRLRYVDGMKIGDVARELGISPRQVQREVRKGLDAVAALLWSRYADAVAPLALPAASREDTPAQPLAGSVHVARQLEAGVPVLAVKLAHPSLPSTLVMRERLLADLDAALEQRLILLSAAAGWGKTTLLSTWASRQARRVAWVSLDALDDNPTRFWVVAIAALRTKLPQIGAAALAMLLSPQPAPLSTVLTMLLEELRVRAGSEPLLLVIDDYHVISDALIHDGIAFVVEHLPPHVHLVIATRVDPELPLSRWRVRGYLAEIRAEALHFSAAEASIFFSKTLGYTLVEEDVRVLESRTEGWIAGLQLAALALRRREDSANFVHTFSGSHRYLLDYVQDEVLGRQPVEVQRFLLQVAVLNRLNAALCATVTNSTNSQSMLEWLERNNLFVAPLDDERVWYRMHDLFREVLLARLQATQPELVIELNRRAAQWFAARGELREAVTHAMAAEDFLYAAALIRRAAPELWLSGDAQTVFAWIKQLPDDVLRRHVPLALDAALRLMESVHAAVSVTYAKARAEVDGAIARVEALLAARHQVDIGPAEQLEPGKAPLAALDVQLLRRINLLRALIASRTCLERGDESGLAVLAEQTAELVEQEEDVRWQLIGHSINYWLGYSIKHEGALLLPRLFEAKKKAAAAGDTIALLRIMSWLAFAYEEAGQPRQVELECLAALDLMAQTGTESATAGYLQIKLANCYYNWNRLQETIAPLEQGMRIAQSWQQADLLMLGGALLMLLRLATGELRGAEQELQKVEDLVAQERFATHSGFVVAIRVYHWLATANLTAAADWAQQVTFSPETWNANRRIEFLLWIRVLLAQQRYGEAIGELDRFSAYLDRPGDVATTIDYLVLRVVAHYSLGDATQARAAAERLLAMTEPGGYIRLYLEAGEPMRRMLQSLITAAHDQQSAISPASAAYVAQLLAAFEQENRRRSRLMPQREKVAPATAAQFPIEPLTRREQEVLRLLVAGASNVEIAAALVISMATVKKHVSNLLGKLGLATRTQVIARANELTHLL